MRVGGSALRHGVTEAQIAHAVRNAIRRIETDDGLTMLIGPTADGTLLEVGVLDFDGDDPAVIHAMILRKKFVRFLR